MKKIFSALVYTFVFMTFTVAAQAMPLYNWDYNLNIDFVNSDGSLTDTFTWETTATNPWGASESTTGTIVGAENAISGSIGFFNQTISQPLAFHHIGSGDLGLRTGTARFEFEIFPDGNASFAQTISFDVDFSVYTEGKPMGFFTVYTPKMDIGNITTSDLSFYYDGYEYSNWTLENIFGFNQAAPNFSLSFDATPSNGPTATPEPATMLLMGAGLAGLGAIRRRRAGK